MQRNNSGHLRKTTSGEKGRDPYRPSLQFQRGGIRSQPQKPEVSLQAYAQNASLTRMLLRIG